MNVLVAGNPEEGWVAGPPAIEGELVRVLEPCVDLFCDCSDGFMGLVSGGIVRTAAVVELDIAPDEHRAVTRRALQGAGWFASRDPEDVAEDLEVFEQLMGMHDSITQRFAPGSLVERHRRGGRAQFRRVRAA